MERIVPDMLQSEESLEPLFKERAETLLSKLEVKAFASEDFELARSEKELEKCRKIAERAQHKAMLRSRDSQAKPSEELTNKERRRKNKKHPSKQTRQKPLKKYRRK